MVILTWALSIIGTLGIGGAIAALVFFPAIAAPILQGVVRWLLGCKVCLIVTALVGVALGSYWYGRNEEYERGHTAALAEIAAGDAKQIGRGLELRSVWEKCRADNGEWNQSTGVCK